MSATTKDRWERFETLHLDYLLGLFGEQPADSPAGTFYDEIADEVRLRWREHQDRDAEEILLHMKKEFTIPKEDWDEVLRLSMEARETPVMSLSMKDGLEGRDFASMARERVFAKWRAIGAKLGFDGMTVEPVSAASRLIRAVPLPDNP